MVHPVSHRLIEIFFATTALKKENGTSNPDVKPLKVTRIGILGAGLMGAGIASVSADKGWSVRSRTRTMPGCAAASPRFEACSTTR